MNKYIKNIDTIDHTWCGQLVEDGTYYQIQKEEELKFVNDSNLLTDIGAGLAILAKSDDGLNDLTDINESINYLKDISEQPLTSDKRPINAVNRIDAGYTIYLAGEGDDITNGTYGGGSALKFDETTPTKDFQMKDNFYAIGGRAIWEGACMDDSMDVSLVAPATTGLVNQSGDYTKYPLGGGANLILPTAVGMGDWDMDLTATLNGNVSILKATPVPQAGNTGWFDYNSDTNTLTRNLNQTGGYNLFDFEINLFGFGRKLWGSKADGVPMIFETTDVVGKLIYSNWVIRFTLNPSTAGVKAALIMTLAAKRNI